MTTKIFVVDAFTDVSFRGNTCAVCVLEEWPDDAFLKNVAIQNQVSETAFIVPRTNANPELRWFTVSQEVDFCGYGTLSAGYVFLKHLAPSENLVTFETRRYGLLPVKKNGDLYQLEVPLKKPMEEIFDDKVFAALGGVRPKAMVKSERGDLLIVYSNEDEVKSVKPDFLKLMANDYYGFVLTGPGQNADFVYRYFSPRLTNVWEDPVNGASISVLTPFWVKKLGKKILHGQAVSTRGGDVYCEYHGDAVVKIAGKICAYMQGELLT